jgi:hypothetical protein
MADSAELTDEQKRFIVAGLACFDSPSEVVAEVKKEFGLELSRQRVQGYDPTKVQGRGLSEHLKTLFHFTRQEYLANEAEIGIANKVHRLRMLERIASKATERGNVMVALQALEQAAKEVGGAFTNRRELSGPNGKPIETKDTTAPAVTPEQVANELAAVFGAALAVAGTPAADQAGSDPVLPAGADGGGTAQPAALPQREAVAGAERPVLPADGHLQAE